MHVRKNHVGKKQFHGVSVYAFKTEIEIQIFFQALSLKKKKHSYSKMKNLTHCTQMRMYIEPDIIVVTMEETVDDFFLHKLKKIEKKRLCVEKMLKKWKKIQWNKMTWIEVTTLIHFISVVPTFLLFCTYQVFVGCFSGSNGHSGE